MNSISNIFIMFNPSSTGPSEDLAQELASDLRSALDIDVALTPTEHAGHANDLAFEIARDNARPLIISSSGDGGYNEVVNGAMRAQDNGAKPICAVLAAGNANDHSRSVLEHPLKDAIIARKVTEVDILKATIASGDKQRARFAHSYIGLGLTPNVAIELNKNRLTRVKETYIVYKTLRDLQPVQIEVDGKRLNLDSLVMANIKNMAKMLTIAEGAQPDDGQFHVTTFPYQKRGRLLYSLIKAAIRSVDGVAVTSYKFTTIKDMPLQFDGEVEDLSANDVVSVNVEPHKLSTFR